MRSARSSSPMPVRRPPRVLPSQLSYSPAYPPPWATSWWWVRRSTTRPLSKTSTQSACSAVERRWAMVIVVRPWASRCMASLRLRSVSGSTLLVASSRISSPAAPGGQALGHGLDPPPQAEVAERSLDLFVTCALVAVADVLTDGVVEEKAVLGDHPDGLAAGRRRDLAEVDKA